MSDSIVQETTAQELLGLTDEENEMAELRVTLALLTRKQRAEQHRSKVDVALAADVPLVQLERMENGSPYVPLRQYSQVLRELLRSAEVGGKMESLEPERKDRRSPALAKWLVFGVALVGVVVLALQGCTESVQGSASAMPGDTDGEVVAEDRPVRVLDGEVVVRRVEATDSGPPQKPQLDAVVPGGIEDAGAEGAVLDATVGKATMDAGVAEPAEPDAAPVQRPPLVLLENQQCGGGPAACGEGLRCSSIQKICVVSEVVAGPGDCPDVGCVDGICVRDFPDGGSSPTVRAHAVTDADGELVYADEMGTILMSADCPCPDVAIYTGYPSIIYPMVCLDGQCVVGCG